MQAALVVGFIIVSAAHVEAASSETLASNLEAGAQHVAASWKFDCQRKALEKNMYVHTVTRWATRRSKVRSPMARKRTQAVYRKLQKLANSKHARDSLRDKCSKDYYRRAIYRHEARFLIARAILRGERQVTRQKQRLHRYTKRMKCTKKMFLKIEPLWRHGGKNLKFHVNICKRMREAWTTKLDIAVAAFKSIRHDRMCNRKLQRAYMNRAKFMVEGTNALCKKQYAKKFLLPKQSAAVQKHVAEYAVEALASHGNERFQDSTSLLARDPVFQAAQAYLRRKTKRFNQFTSNRL